MKYFLENQRRKEGRSSIVEKAIQFATKAHEGQVRKGVAVPYIFHPMEVMEIVSGILEFAADACERAYGYFLNAIIKQLEKC